MLNKEESTGHILALITIFIWGTTFISTKILLNNFSPIEILFTRFLLGFLALWAIYPHALKFCGRYQEIYFALAGLSGVTLYFLFENIALCFSYASNVGIIMSTSPFFTAVLASFVLKERLKKRFMFGFLLAMIGIGLINFNGISILKLNPIGDFLALSASFLWAVYSILMKKIGSFGIPTIQVTRRTFLYGLLFMLPVMLIDFHPKDYKLLDAVDIFNFVYLGFGASAICFSSWNKALKILGAVKVNGYIYAIPVITVITSSLILRENITYLAWAGMAFAILGLFISEHDFSTKKI